MHLYIKETEVKEKKSNPWWWRVPIYLLCLSFVYVFIVIGTQAQAATDGQLSAVLAAGIDAFVELLKWLLDVLITIW